MLAFEAEHANFGAQNNKITKARCLMRQNRLFRRLRCKNETMYKTHLLDRSQP